ncbi:MAG: RNA-binding protein [Cyanobacteria bacterium SZAS-4]|nr:RNA-binding protein [Cyanobacteria bacterium SZAS-4]
MPNCILVGNLAIETTEDSIHKIFSRIGLVQHVSFVVDHKGAHRGFAYVIFDTRIQAQKAVESMNGIECDNRKLTVNFKSAPKIHKQGLLSRIFNFYGRE